MSSLKRGIAFIFEGQTESVFYFSMLEHFVAKREGYVIKNEVLEKVTNEYNLYRKVVNDYVHFQIY